MVIFFVQKFNNLKLKKGIEEILKLIDLYNLMIPLKKHLKRKIIMTVNI